MKSSHHYSIFKDKETDLKKTITFISLIVCSIFICCSDDPKPSCPAPIGEMVAQVNDTTIWEFKYVSFRRWSEYVGSQESDSLINISADFINAGCEMELTLDFQIIARTLNRQNLVKRIFEEDHPSKLQPHSIFYTWNVDALTERFELYEGEPAWIQLSEINEETVTGTFQGTYVYRQSAFRFWDLPDTLRFNNVPFEAILFVPPKE
ncbi:MAG: hypothetical protein GY816_12790 [Cytophagales bacterium]|nr:hypothetical protein [Cytophagales bacterium]